MHKKGIAFLGPSGNYTHLMAQQFFPEGLLVPYFSIDQVLEAVERGEVEQGIVPIENSTEGAVLTTMDLLAHEVHLFIVEERSLKIEHCLWCHPKQEKIEKILSHPQALGQCRRYLQKKFPEIPQVPMQSSAEAMQEVAENGEILPIAAIGGKIGGSLRGLKKVAENIQDVQNNATRFVRVKKEKEEILDGQWIKISFVCKLDGKRAGSLQELLSEFSSRGINLTRIESRPTGAHIGEYYFFIDIVDQSDSETWKEALRSVEKNSLWYKDLGCYPQKV